MASTERLRLFHETVVPDAEKLIALVQQGAQHEAMALIHRLKGVMLYLRAAEGATILEDMEGNAEMMPSLAKKLHALLISDEFSKRHFAQPASV